MNNNYNSKRSGNNLEFALIIIERHDVRRVRKEQGYKCMGERGHYLVSMFVLSLSLSLSLPSLSPYRMVKFHHNSNLPS